MIKYFDFRNRMENIYNFIELYEVNNLAETKFILSFDIFKSYLYNKSIPVLNKEDTTKEFFETFLNISDFLEQTIIYISSTKSFFKGEYLEKFRQYFEGDFIELIDKEIYALAFDSMKPAYVHGTKPMFIKVFVMVRQMYLKYCSNLKNNIDDIESDEISKILMDGGFDLFDVNFIIEHLLRPWFKGTFALMIKSFNDFQNSSKFTYIILFICLMVLVILYYFIIWKSYEKKMSILLKESANLINLIPQEIKDLIIEKLNE